MWVKIKNDKIPNVILDVPYSAFLNSYKRKGFKLVSENNKKQTNNDTNEQSIKLDDEDLTALKEIKEQNSIYETDSKKTTEIENDDIINNKIKDFADKKSKKEIIDDIIEDTKNDNSSSYIANRTPIKKTNSKR